MALPSNYTQDDGTKGTSTSSSSSSSQQTGICYTSDGSQVGVYLVNGQCPQGLFASSPVQEDTFTEQTNTEEQFGDSYDINDLLDDLVDFDPDEGESGEEELLDITEGQVRICWTSCSASGNSSGQAFYGLDACPVTHPFSEQQDCSEIRDSLEDLVNAYEQQLADAEGANDEELQALQDKIEELQAAMETPVIIPAPLPTFPETPAPQKAGLGDIPPWAILAGLGVVAVIAILGGRRRQPVVVQAK